VILLPGRRPKLIFPEKLADAEITRAGNQELLVYLPPGSRDFPVCLFLTPTTNFKNFYEHTRNCLMKKKGRKTLVTLSLSLVW
jgi:hypothetical protein